MHLNRWQQILLLSLYTAAITVLSLTPAQDMPAINLWDKLQHFGAYFVFMVFAYPVSNSSRGRMACALLIIAYSALMEYGQSLMPGRAPSAADLLANSLGVASGFISMTAINALLNRRKR